MIESSVYEQLRTKKVYALTKKGKDLVPVLVEMILWSAKYHDELAVPQAFLDKAKRNKTKLIATIMERLG